MEETLYTQNEVVEIILNLVNGIGHCAIGDVMPKRYKEQVEVNGQKRWLTGYSIADLLEEYLKLCIDANVVVPAVSPYKSNKTVLFGDYLETFVDTYKCNQESLTKNNRTNMISKHIKPKWGSREIASITPTDLQQWFNQLAEEYSHETLMKIKNIMSPAFDAAVEEHLIERNPLKSTLLTIGGAETKPHKALPTDKMKQIRESLSKIKEERVRFMASLLSYTGMRMEEVLGLKWEDIDFEDDWIYINRAVVHPKRSAPEIKPPKSKTSKRRIPLAPPLKDLLKPRQLTGFLLYAAKDEKRETPLSYTEARRAMEKIRTMFGIEEYSAHDFRDTCATEWREKGIPLDVISSLLGHAKVEVTQNRYVKYRDEIFQDVREIMGA